MVLILLKMHFFTVNCLGGEGGGQGGREVAIKICACVCKQLVLTESHYLKCAFRVLVVCTTCLGRISLLPLI